ncbi:ArnT family glycosyltransferase [Jongsikchunia kroppenstedtii]|uniref:ArnT family glycosyltransferase n=1 Tax=Jongsikchunia kroppenstedtii TaxID=1121721 RepID=UPI0003A3A1A7|nr:glycosyltransferase family 39 protein [Jongsikchunia kroppenstedtii]
MRRLGSAPAVVGVAAVVSGIAVFWHINRAPVEPYYAAAAHSMARNWHNFFFAAADWNATVSIDKLPGGVWPSAICCAIFGTHTWAIVLPNALAAVAAVIAIYFPIRRMAGPAAGAVAAVTLALMPVLIALGRGNIPDMLMILLLILALGEVTAAAEGMRMRLLTAAVLVGLAFEVKMLAAWLVLPALALGYMLRSERGWRVKIADLAAAGAVTAVVSLIWPVVVGLFPAAHRPHVDGTSDNSVLSQTFSYNGFSRTGHDTPNHLLQQQGLPLNVPAGAPGLGRLLHDGMGREGAWLLPLCVLVAVAGVAARRGRPPHDPLRAGYLMLLSWLLIYFFAFSFLTEINPYYVVALAPPVAGIVALGAVQLWQMPMGRPFAIAAVAVIVTAGYGTWLAYSGPTWTPVALTVLSLAAIVALGLIVLRWRRATPVVVAMLAVAMMPSTVAAATLPVRDEGATDIPLESQQLRRELTWTFRTSVTDAAKSIPALRRAQRGAPYLMASQSAALGSVFAINTDAEVYPIGGYDGRGASPTMDQLRRAVAQGEFHFVVGLKNTTDPRMLWIDRACRPEPSTATWVSIHVCTSASARVR